MGSYHPYSWTRFLICISSKTCGHSRSLTKSKLFILIHVDVNPFQESFTYDYVRNLNQFNVSTGYLVHVLILTTEYLILTSTILK